MEGITHVIHCAGCVKAVRVAEFYEVNEGGTRNLVVAANAASAVQRFIQISSLAAAGPGTRENPARESRPSQPVSEYGRSKLAGELELQKLRGAQPVIIRPPAVYGPRDTALLPLFKAVRRHVLPAANPGQAVSLVYVKDLANAVVACANHPQTAGKTYFVAGTESVTAFAFARAIAAQLGTWTVPCPLPAALLWPICLACEAGMRLTGRANILSLQKFAELRAPGWVCDASLIRRELGFECQTALSKGIAETLAWYRQVRWL